MTARDLRHGRDQWTDSVPRPPIPCDVCGRPVTTGGDRHAGCTPPDDQLTLALD